MLFGTLIALISVSIFASMLLAFRGPREIWDLDQGSGVLVRLGRRKSRLLRVLKDLEEEHDRGSLEGVEFHRLQGEYKRRTVEVMRELDRVRSARIRHIRTGNPTVSTASRKRIEEAVARRRRSAQSREES